MLRYALYDFFGLVESMAKVMFFIVYLSKVYHVRSFDIELLGEHHFVNYYFAEDIWTVFVFHVEDHCFVVSIEIQFWATLLFLDCPLEV